MTEQSAQGSGRKSLSYASRLRDSLQLWTEARRAATYEDTIFIWIPKNAGTSVYNMLRKDGLVKLNTTRSIRLCFRNSGRVTFGHMAIGSLVDLGLVSPEFVQRAFKFAIVRDPYARAVSLYRYLSRTDILQNWHRQPTFREFLTWLAEGYYDRIGAYNWRGLSQCNPQVEWLRDAWPDEVYKLEDAADFTARIRGRLRTQSGDMPQLNTSEGRNQLELAREDMALIERIYAGDFEAFGYRKRQRV